MKINDLVHPGQIVIVRKPHQRLPTVTSFDNFEQAFDVYTTEEGVEKLPPFKDQTSENFNYDEQFKKTVREDLKKRGITENEPYFEVPNWNSEYKYFKCDKEGKQELLQELADEDMYSSYVFTAQKDETYKQFFDRIYSRTRGHNAPSYVAIETSIYLDERRTFNLELVEEVAQYCDWDVEHNEKDKTVTLTNGKTTHQLPYEPDRIKDFLLALQEKQQDESSKELLDNFLEAFEQIKTSNYTKEYVAKEFDAELQYQKEKLGEKTSTVKIASEAQKNILAFEGKGKKELLQQFFKEKNIEQKEQLRKYVENKINPQEKQKARTNNFERQR